MNMLQIAKDTQAPKCKEKDGQVKEVCGNKGWGWWGHMSHTRIRRRLAGNNRIRITWGRLGVGLAWAHTHNITWEYNRCHMAWGGACMKMGIGMGRNMHNNSEAGQQCLLRGCMAQDLYGHSTSAAKCQQPRPSLLPLHTPTLTMTAQPK